MLDFAIYYFPIFQGRKAIQNVLKKITIENILSTVTNELHELSSDVDQAASKLDFEFNITERVLELSKDLEQATSMINSEIQLFSNKLHTEFLQLIRTLNSELSQVVVKIKLSEHGSNVDLSKISLCEAVTQAGISGKSRNS